MIKKIINCWRSNKQLNNMQKNYDDYDDYDDKKSASMSLSSALESMINSANLNIN